ncbi:glycosyltransferase [Christiangramia echinicola]|uniref:glycosyltransferase n=1 Tax=Christiangramia echinicola TaxID=279359 RepID=UPI000405F036|nr:glycosyltransferase [Christiangramia echinicola]
MIKYKVSVRLITFNHSQFIEKSIEGVLMQQSNFLIELIIGDDFSTDNTRDLIANYKSTKNVHIKFLDRPFKGEYFYEREKNGRLYNFANTVSNCTGEYIALLDGDDYWTDPYKLQKQVDFLENDLNFSACFTDAIVYNEHSKEKSNYLNKNKKRSTFHTEDIIKGGGGLFPTASLVFRNLIHDFPNFFYEAKSGDRALSLLLSVHGSFYCMGDVTCVYRVHNGGIFSNIIEKKEKRNDITRNNIKLLQDFDIHSNFVFTKIIKQTISNLSKKVLINSKSELKMSLIRNLTLRDFLSYIKNFNLK